jgi:hypothetical protein
MMVGGAFVGLEKVLGTPSSSAMWVVDSLLSLSVPLVAPKSLACLVRGRLFLCPWTDLRALCCLTLEEPF